MTLKTSAKLAVTAASDTQVSSDTKIEVSAANDLSMKATNVAVAGQAEAKVEGDAEDRREGQAKAEIGAAMAKVAAQGQLGSRVLGAWRTSRARSRAWPASS